MKARMQMLLAALLLASGAGAAEPVAEVFIVDGTAKAGERALARGDAIENGAVVSTDASSRVGLFAGEIYVQLDPESAVRFERDEQNRVQVELEAGRARIVDTRGSGEPGTVAAGGGEARIEGGDKEVYLLSEKTGRYAMFCDWTAPLAVSGNQRDASADPGDCILVKPGEAPYAARGHDHQIPLLSGPDDGPADLLVSRFGPDVAAGPFHGFPGPAEVPDRERDPCDIPGSGCEGALRIVDPPPDPDDCAPGVIGGGEAEPAVVYPAPDVDVCAPGMPCE
jgi:hypothetical protein